jgi:hypothetical protein
VKIEAQKNSFLMMMMNIEIVANGYHEFNLKHVNSCESPHSTNLFGSLKLNNLFISKITWNIIAHSRCTINAQKQDQ